MTLAERLFAWRGVVLAGAGLALALVAKPTASSWALGTPVIVLGLALRGWAFHHLGSVGRTRDPAAPGGRVISGPYAVLPHPVYLANYLVALGLVLTAEPGPILLALFLALVAAVYGLLARREGAQVADLPARPSASMGLAGVARSERSTWASVGALLAAQAVMGAMRS